MYVYTRLDAWNVDSTVLFLNPEYQIRLSWFYILPVLMNYGVYV